LAARRKVRRLTDDCLLLCRASPDQVADHNEAGRDPAPYLQGRTGIRGELRNQLHKTEPGANCALSTMFMRLWIAEIGENAVAHVFCDEATIALDQFRAAAVIGSNDAPQILGVEPSRAGGARQMGQWSHA
jgi:hypothetical protein